MPIVADAVKAERLAVAQKWMDDNGPADTELVYSSATGYYVPKKYRSKSTKDIEDENVLNLMKAQGYKPRAKKSPSVDEGPIVLASDTESNGVSLSDAVVEHPKAKATLESSIEKLVNLLEKWDVQGIKVVVTNA